MRRALAISLALHGALVVSGLIYFPMAVENFSTGHVVPVDLVTLSDTTNVRARAPDPVVEDQLPEEETPIETPVPEPESREPRAQHPTSNK